MRVSNNSKKVKREQKEAREELAYSSLRMLVELEAFKQKFEESTKVSPTKVLMGEKLFEIYDSEIAQDGVVLGMELFMDNSLEEYGVTFK